MTKLVPAMWSVWGVLVLMVIVLKLYLGKLTQDEYDQIILDESFDHVRNEQAAIVAKVAKVEPLERVVLWLTGAATVFVIAYYILDIVNQFR